MPLARRWPITPAAFIIRYSFTAASVWEKLISLQAIGNEIAKRTNKVLYTTSENFTNDYMNSVRSGKAKDFKDRYRNVDLLLIDDLQFMGGKDGTQQEFFHTFNELQQADKQIILTSDKPPKLIPALEARLASRFESGMVAESANRTWKPKWPSWKERRGKKLSP